MEEIEYGIKCLSEDETKSMVGTYNWEKFCEWIVGQTCPLLSDGSCGYYLHDVARFCESILSRKPTYWD